MSERAARIAAAILTGTMLAAFAAYLVLPPLINGWGPTP